MISDEKLMNCKRLYVHHLTQKIESLEKRLFRKKFTKENNKNNKRSKDEHADDKNGRKLKSQRVMFDKEVCMYVCRSYLNVSFRNKLVEQNSCYFE